MENDYGLACDEEKLQDIREQFIHELSTNLHLYGMTESVGRLYGTLLFEKHPLTLDEMSNRLQMSKTSMSTGIRQLAEANMAKKVWRKGVRKDLYTGEEDWYESFVAIFSKQWRSAVENNKKASLQMERHLYDLKCKTNNNHIQTKIDEDLRKVTHAKDYYMWIESFIEFLDSGEIFEHLPKKPYTEKPSS